MAAAWKETTTAAKEPPIDTLSTLGKPWEQLGTKGSCYWIPEHNLGVNRSVMNWNLWQFSILPLFPDKYAYREDKNALVLKLSWIPFGNDTIDNLTPEIADKTTAMAKGRPTIEQTVSRQLDWIANKFGIEIPSVVRTNITKDARKAAPRRWGVNRLRVKSVVWPLDGSPKYEE